VRYALSLLRAAVRHDAPLGRRANDRAGHDFPVNRGGLCRKGWTAAELLHHPERLTAPLMREEKRGELRPASWDEALDRIVNEIRRIQSQHGRDAIGVFGSGALTNEKAYALGKFARVALRSSQIDYNGRFCMSSAAAASIKAFGLDRGLPFPIADIPKARTILLVGSNAAETMPPIMQYFQAQRTSGGSLIVADPRKSPTAAAATLHLQITPGSDVALANGLVHLAIRESYADEEFIQLRTNGFEQVRRAVSRYWPDRVERITGIPEKQLIAAIRLLGQAETAMILTGPRSGATKQGRG
jgi:assimilatory nitrate reductase catalytic subunit